MGEERELEEKIKRRKRIYKDRVQRRKWGVQKIKCIERKGDEELQDVMGDEEFPLVNDGDRGV